jgi:hypothetical protein
MPRTRPVDETPYTEMEPQSRGKTCMKYTCKIVGGFLLVFIVVVGLIQVALYKWATLHCSAGQLKDYEFPGGGEDAAVNLVPPDSLLVEQDPKWWGSSFINNPANKDGLPEGASTGVYYRTWGPLWWTVTYQDIMSKETFVIRDRPIALGGSHKIMRCDGTGPVYVVTEGTHVFMNAIRELFGMYTSRIYNIYEDNKLVAVSSKLGGSGQSHKQMVFRKPGDDNPFASAFLKDRHYHGRFDEWFVQVEKDAPLPNFVPNSVAVLMAFATAGLKNHTAAPGEMLELLEEAPQDVEPEREEEEAHLEETTEQHV